MHIFIHAFHFTFESRRVIWFRLLLLLLPLVGWCVIGLSFLIDLLCMLYHCHKLVHLCIESITVDRGKVGRPLDDCGVHPTQKCVYGVHSPHVCVLAFDNVIILICNIVFLQLDILNGGFFENKEKFCPPNGSGVVFASKPWNVTSILARPALHALPLEVNTFFRDAEEPFVFLVPMSTKILAEDLALSFIFHAPCLDFYFIVGCHPQHWIPFQRNYHLWPLQCPIPCHFVPPLSEIHEAMWLLVQKEVPFIELKLDRHFSLNVE